MADEVADYYGSARIFLQNVTLPCFVCVVGHVFASYGQMKGVLYHLTFSCIHRNGSQEHTEKTQ